MFRVLTPIIRSWYSCNYSFWHWSTGSISVDNSTSFGCRHPPSGARTTVITASGTGQPGLLPSAIVVELELIHVYCRVFINSITIADGSRPG